MIEYYPTDDAKFRLCIDKRGGEWIYTLRTDGAFRNTEIARFNSMVMARMGINIAKKIVDSLNAKED